MGGRGILFWALLIIPPFKPRMSAHQNNKIPNAQKIIRRMKMSYNIKKRFPQLILPSLSSFPHIILTNNKKDIERERKMK
tara:strand:+ start:432 stop:671 length:240 start_codon:yes stop_codon:yes gene_type:complete